MRSALRPNSLEQRFEGLYITTSRLLIRTFAKISYLFFFAMNALIISSALLKSSLRSGPSKAEVLKKLGKDMHRF